MLKKWQLCFTLSVLMALSSLSAPLFSTGTASAAGMQVSQGIEYVQTGPRLYNVILNRSLLPNFTAVRLVLSTGPNDRVTDMEKYVSPVTSRMPDGNGSLVLRLPFEGTWYLLTAFMDDKDKVTAYSTTKLITPVGAVSQASPISTSSPSAGNGLTPPQNAAVSNRFPDVTASHWAFEPVSEMSKRGAIEGYPDGLFRPDKIVTRAELAKIMVLAAGLKERPVTVSSFADILPGDWYASYVETAKPFLTGFSQANGSIVYAPDAPALREDMTIAVVRLKGYDTSTALDESILQTMFSDEKSISKVARKYVALAVTTGLVSGYPDGTFRAQDPITRAQAAALLHRAFQYGNANKVDFPSTNPANPNVVPPSTVIGSTYGSVTQSTYGTNGSVPAGGSGSIHLIDKFIVAASDITRVRKEKSNSTNDLVINATNFNKNNYELTYTLAGETVLSGYIGLNSNSGPSVKVSLQVFGDGIPLFTSEEISAATAYIPFFANVSQIKSLTIRFTFQGKPGETIEPVLRNAELIK